GDGGAEALEAELRQKGNVLPKGVVEIDPLVVGVPLSRQHAVCDAAQHAGTAAGEDVGHADALSVLIPGPLQLSGAHRAAPSKMFRNTHGVPSNFPSCSFLTRRSGSPASTGPPLLHSSTAAKSSALVTKTGVMGSYFRRISSRSNSTSRSPVRIRSPSLTLAV